jgi:hypothetical protein
VPKRKYAVQRYYAVFCSECNEDITEGPTHTKADAEAQQKVHEAWHARDDAAEAAEQVENG